MRRRTFVTKSVGVRAATYGAASRLRARGANDRLTVGHLGTIAYRTGRKLTWDGEREDFIDAADASRLLGRTARKPWDLISL